MSNCERRLLSRVTIARIAYTGITGVFVLGCTGDEPAQVSAAEQPSVLVAQTPIDGATVPKYVTPLTTLGDGARVDGTRSINVDMVEFQQKVLPSSMYASLPAPFNNGTFLWGYRVDGKAAHFPAATIEARQNTTTTVRYNR